MSKELIRQAEAAYRRSREKAGWLDAAVSPRFEDGQVHEVSLVQVRRALMKLYGQTNRAVAQELGVAPPTVAMVIMGVTKSRRIETHLADLLGVAVERLFPRRGPTNKSISGDERGVNLRPGENHRDAAA
jgi:hypothetical protein